LATECWTRRKGLPCWEKLLKVGKATLLLTKNVNPKVVSELLGHATIAITLDTYSHVLPTMQKSAAAAMEDALT
jgi:integrase